MLIQPSEHPGAHERHLWRKHQNPLFPAYVADDHALLDAQRQDYDARQAFNQEFRALLQAVGNLGNHSDSDTLLQLKERLDRAYEMACGLGDDQNEAKAAIRKLLRLIMTGIRKGAGDDLHAQMELDQEEMAREAHFALLEAKLVADLLNPTSPIQPDELVPTLLCSPKEELSLALQMFDAMQLPAILNQGASLLEQLQSQGIDVKAAQERLAFIQGYAEFVVSNAANSA